MFCKNMDASRFSNQVTGEWQGCVLITPYPNNPKPVDQFYFATDMDFSCKRVPADDDSADD
jgi:hypothetical protein